MNKKILFTFILALLFVASACSNRNKVGNVDMNQLASDNLYHYTNKDLAFSLDLPEQFIYYQTQKVKKTDYEEIQFFVPTNDASYPQEVQSYAKALFVRIYDKDKWDSIRDDNVSLIESGERKGTIYVIGFWNKVPRDWENKWSEVTKTTIKNSLILD